MEKVYIVICDTLAVVMGVFSDFDNATACKEYYENKFPNEKYVIYSEYVDLIEF